MVVNNNKKQASLFTFHLKLPAPTEVLHFAIMNPQSNLHCVDPTEARNCIQSQTHIWFAFKTQPHTTWGLTLPGHHSTQKPPPYSRLWRWAEWPSCFTPRANAAKRVIQYSQQQTHKHVKGIVLRQSWVTATACQWGKITDWMPVTTNPSLKAAFNSNVGKTRNRTTTTTAMSSWT